MARGKHAALSSQARYEAAMEHLRRVTDELADYKIRVRSVEAEATRVPILLARISELEALVDANTSAQLEAVKAGHEDRHVAAQLLVDGLSDILMSVFDRWPEAVMSKAELEFLRDHGMADVVAPPVNRADRRWKNSRRVNHDYDVQDNRRSLGENLDSAGLPPHALPVKVHEGAS